MKKDYRNKIILLGLILSIIMFIIMVSGCTTPEKIYEDDVLSFTVPANWNVDKTKFSDELASLRPVYVKYPVIYIHQSDLKPDEVIDGYITHFPHEYPRFKVVIREDVMVNGLNGEKLVYKNTAQDDFLLMGPDFFSVVVVFQKDNNTYIISSSESMEHSYHSQVEPALNVLMDSVKIKE